MQFCVRSPTPRTAPISWENLNGCADPGNSPCAGRLGTKSAIQTAKVIEEQTGVRRGLTCPISRARARTTAAQEVLFAFPDRENPASFAYFLVFATETEGATQPVVPKHGVSP
jgi:hypothetical protein